MCNIEKVKSFIAAWEQRDIEAILEAVAPDVFYHNIPMPEMVGRDALRKFAAPFLAGAKSVEWVLHHIAETDLGEVLTERTDHFHMAGGNTISLRVMGIFEFNEAGQIQSWRDYFDLA